MEKMAGKYNSTKKIVDNILLATSENQFFKKSKNKFI